MQKNNFSFQPSKQYLSILTIILIASTLIILFYIPNFILKIAALFSLLIYAKPIYQAAILKNPNAILSIKYMNNDQWLLQTPKGEYYAKITGDSTVTSYFCLLRFQSEKQHVSSIVMKDSLLADDYRRLLVRLRC